MLPKKSLGENAGLRLASKRGCVVKKHPQVGLRVSFQQQIQHSRSESIRVFYLFIRIYLGNRWFKCVISGEFFGVSF